MGSGPSKSKKKPVSAPIAENNSEMIQKKKRSNSSPEPLSSNIKTNGTQRLSKMEEVSMTFSLLHFTSFYFLLV